jgi:uncharacterized membrane protein YheB (UPF0754 family)
MTAVDELKTIIEGRLLQLVKERLGDFRNIANKVNEVVQEVLTERLKKIQSDVYDQLEITAQTPYTQNDYYEKSVVDNLVENLTLGEKLEDHFVSYINYSGSDVISKVKAINKETNDRVAGSLQSIMLSSAIQAYIQVCFKRFCDNVPNLILLHFMEKLAEDISSKLTDLLSQHISDIDDLVVMDANVAELHQRLCESEKRLTKCLEIVNKNMV